MPSGKVIKNERGMVLLLAIFLVAALSLMGVAANKNVAIDTAISSSYLTSIQSFYIAEAGLEKGQLEAATRLVINDWVSFTPLIDGTDVTSLGLKFDSATAFGGGSYTVTISNDPGDASPTVDTNRTVVVRSTGSYRNAVSTVSATVRMLTIPRLPAAVTLVGEAGLTVGEGPYRISGYNHPLADTESSPSDPLEARAGVALCGSGNGGAVVDFVNAMNKNNQIDGSVDIATSNDMTLKGLEDYVTSLKPFAKNTVDCDSFNVTYAGTDLVMNCPTGRGILIVDANLDFTENCSWQGLVVVRSGTLSLDGPNSVKGGVIIAACSGVGGAQGQNARLRIGPKGGTALLYSRDAINNANRALTGKQGKWMVSAWRRSR